MTRREYVNEQSAYEVQITPLSTTNTPYTPSNARYRVDDSVSKVNHVAWTNLTPATTMAIAIPATANVIQNASCAEEVKILTVQVDYNTSDQMSIEHEYVVRNLEFVS